MARSETEVKTPRAMILRFDPGEPEIDLAKRDARSLCDTQDSGEFAEQAAKKDFCFLPARAHGTRYRFAALIMGGIQSGTRDEKSAVGGNYCVHLSECRVKRTEYA